MQLFRVEQGDDGELRISGEGVELRIVEPLLTVRPPTFAERYPRLADRGFTGEERLGEVCERLLGIVEEYSERLAHVEAWKAGQEGIAQMRAAEVPQQAPAGQVRQYTYGKSEQPKGPRGQGRRWGDDS